MPLGSSAPTKLQLVKTSALPGLTDGNPCYSLAGAVYGVYSERSDDGALSGRVGELVTDAGGRTAPLDVRPGTYYVVEERAPEGYLPDGEVHSVRVWLANTATVEVSDVPVLGPAGMPVQKVDAATGEAVPEGEGSLSGAEVTFRYYAGYYGEGEVPESADRTWVVRTDGEGRADIAAGCEVVAGDDFYTDGAGGRVLPLGTVTAVETKAPTGYLLGEPKLYVAQVRPDASAGGAALVKVNYGDGDAAGNAAGALIEEQPKRGDLEVLKRDAETADGSAQGDATLSGAVFEVVNESTHAVVSPETGEAVGPGGVVCRIVTGADGLASTARADLNGWAAPEGWGGRALAFGRYSVREARAPEGYERDASWGERVVIDADGKVVRLEMADSAVRGGVAVGKFDLGNGLCLAEGAASLEGAVFEVVNRGAADVMVGGVRYAPGAVVAAVTAARADDGRVVASTAASALPFSTYELREAQAPEGYLPGASSEAWSRTFQVRDSGIVDLTGPADAAGDQVVRGDVSFTKARAASGERLPGVPFKVTSKTTGEWHVVVTDANGQASTSAAGRSHLARTNANDAAIGPDGAVDASKLDPAAGVWFHGRTDVQAAVDDGLGALPYDTYAFEELRCPANEGLVLVSFEVAVTRDGREVDLGTVDDRDEPSIGTELRGPDGTHVAPAAEGAALTDEVAYRDLPAGDYTVEGELHLVGADGADEGVVATAGRDFTASSGSGSVEVAFEVDARGLGGGTLVAFERVVAADGTVVAAHEDLSDAGQAVTVPKVGTSLADAADGDREVSSAGMARLVDTVSYEGLEPGRVYRMRAALHLRGEGGEDLGEAVDASGEPVTSSQAFTPDAPSGTVEVAFSFEPARGTGATLVAFEELEYAGRAYAAHADISDENQSVDVPWIATQAADAATGMHVGSGTGGKLRVSDIVRYEALQPGTEYELAGELHRRGDSGEDLGAVLDVIGEPVTAHAAFVPAARAGSVELLFEAEVENLAGSTFVAFEELSRGGAVVAAHADISDGGQSVSYPALSTRAGGLATGTHTAANDREGTVCDAVFYGNLVPGEEYSVRGALHLRSEGGEDLGELRGADGEPVTAEAEITPEEASGAVELTFDVDGALLAGKTVVAFETLFCGGVEVAAHEDIADADQSVSFPAALQTAALSRATGTRTLPAGEATAIVDEVSYRNLVPGETYELAGEVHVRADDGSDAGVLEVGGAPVAATARFMPEEPDGTVEMSFAVDAAGLAGSALVVFEELRTADGAHVASHADISDEGQTVTVPAIATTATDKASGGHEGEPAERVTVVDEISYSGLTPGRAYRVEGVLMDKGTGEPYGAEGAEVAASAEFTAEAASGTVAVEFGFDGTALAGATLVAFERLYDAGGALVAAHEDAGDAAQTVSYGPPEPSITTKVNREAKFYDRTGDWLLDRWPALLAAAALAGAGAVVLARRRKGAGEGDGAE